MGKASRAKQQRKRVRNPATAYLDWLAGQDPAPHNCVPRPVDPPPMGVCRCGRRWKATFGRPGPPFYGRVIGWEAAGA